MVDKRVLTMAECSRIVKWLLSQPARTDTSERRWLRDGMRHTREAVIIMGSTPIRAILIKTGKHTTGLNGVCKAAMGLGRTMKGF